MSLAEEPTIVDCLNESGNITVFQPDALNSRLRLHGSSATEENQDDTRIMSASPTVKVRAGYRVQVFDDNNVRTAKSEAYSRKSKIETRFPDMAVYVTFSSPYWRVKVGDFRTRGEAEAAMAEFRQAFPESAKSLRIVRDRINAK